MVDQTKQSGPDAVWMMFRKVDRNWSPGALLSQDGWFPLADVMKQLDPENTGKYRRILAHREKSMRESGDCVRIMGLKQYGSRIWADMKVFREWYENNELLWIHRIPKNWDLQTFLDQKTGIFSLKGVLQLMPEDWPIKYPAMKNLIRKNQDPRTEIGADKLGGANYVVFMPKFGEWIQKQMT